MARVSAGTRGRENSRRGGAHQAAPAVALVLEEGVRADRGPQQDENHEAVDEEQEDRAAIGRAEVGHEAELEAEVTQRVLADGRRAAAVLLDERHARAAAVLAVEGREGDTAAAHEQEESHLVALVAREVRRPLGVPAAVQLLDAAEVVDRVAVNCESKVRGAVVGKGGD